MIKTYSKKPINEKIESVVASTYGLPSPSNNDIASRLAQIDDMKLFFVSATQQWEHNRPLKRFALPGGESISCVFWDDLFFITGTDIVRSLTFRFYAFGRPVTNPKKFEEGIFSDLRNLKPGHDARLEEPKSELLDMLYKNNCIRTQKKQKVFFWFSVPHDRLFLDALERDLKREKLGQDPTTKALAEPAASLSLDSTQELFDQLRKNMSQSAAVTAQSIEQDILSPIPITSLSLNSANTTSHQLTGHSYLDQDSQDWASSDWSTIQSKRPRVNSVPSSIGQKQQLQLLQQQQRKQNRLSHGSYFSNSSYRSNRLSSSSSSMLASPEDLYFRDDASSSTTTLTDTMPKPNLSTPLNKYDYLDPISNGVHQLEISSSLSSTSMASQHQLLHHNSVLPSKSLDSNVVKKTKTIFGNLSLFDGSPTYKLRRRRASSVSTSLLNLHPRKSRTTPIVSNSSSRLAMAAMKAGLVPPPPSTSHDYNCPVPECRHLFKRMEHLERHMQSLHTFTCTVCGKAFAKSEILLEHHRLEHPVYEQTPSLNYGDHDDDSSYDGKQQQHYHPHHSHYSQFMPTFGRNTHSYTTNNTNNTNSNNNNNNTQVLGHATTTTTLDHYSFDGSRSSGWSNSRSSTLSPVTDSKLLYSFYSEPSSLSPSPEPMTLLSPFKFQQQQYQQQQQQQQLPFDVDMNNFINDYVPYVDQQFNPFSPDMNIGFGA